MFNLLQKIWDQIKSSLKILEVFQIAESIAVIVGIVIALKTYNSQVRQEKVNNSFSLLDSFTRHIKETDISILKSVCQNSYEGCGADKGHFVTFYNNQIEQNCIASLFLEEGQGLFVKGSLEITETPKDQAEGITLGSVRLIAEQLNIIAYEVFKGQIEIRIVYYELNEIIKDICNLLDIAIKMDSDNSYNLKTRFKYLLKMKKKFPLEKFPKRSFGELC